MDNSGRVEDFWFRTAFLQSPLPQCIADASGQWREVNDALCQALRYSREEILRVSERGMRDGKCSVWWRYNFVDLMPTDDQPVRLAESRLFDYPGTGRNRGGLYLDIQVSRLKSSSGETIGLLGRFERGAHRATIRNLESERARLHKDGNGAPFEHIARSATAGKLCLLRSEFLLPEPLEYQSGPFLFGTDDSTVWDRLEASGAFALLTGERREEFQAAVHAAIRNCAEHGEQKAGQAMASASASGDGKIQVRVTNLIPDPTGLSFCRPYGSGRHSWWAEDISWKWRRGFEAIVRGVDRVYFYWGDRLALHGHRIPGDLLPEAEPQINDPVGRYNIAKQAVAVLEIDLRKI